MRVSSIADLQAYLDEHYAPAVAAVRRGETYHAPMRTSDAATVEEPGFVGTFRHSGDRIVRIREGECDR